MGESPYLSSAAASGIAAMIAEQKSSKARYHGAMAARLSISTEEGLVLDAVLASQPLRIGRAKDNSLRIDDRRTSRHHAIVRLLPDGGYEVEDLGSSYGTLLNGRRVSKEPLKHQDLLRCGALSLQFLTDPLPGSSTDGVASDDPSIMTATIDNLFESRAQVRRLIEEQALLRREVGIAQEAEDRAKRLRDEAQDEVERLHDSLAELRKENASMQAQLEQMGRELRERRSVKSETPPEVALLQQQLADAQRQSDRHKSRAVELEDREAARVVSEQGLRKELERLSEQLKGRDQREAQLTQAVKPALMRIGELSLEMEQLRLKLAHAEADLAYLKRSR
jgi:pSer/pThr/pTyr-binding forkhead associated (FHA) protein